MCTVITHTKFLQSPMMAYAVRFKNKGHRSITKDAKTGMLVWEQVPHTYTSPYFNNKEYYIDKRYRALELSGSNGKNKIGDKIYAGFFHMFLTYDDALTAKKKMHPYINSVSKKKFKIVKIKIYSRQRVYFGSIPRECQNRGMETVCAKHIVHLEEIKPKKSRLL